MIFTDRTIMVKNGTSSINDTIVLYRGDRDVEIRFTLNEGTPFKFGSGASPNIIEKTEATYGQLIIKTPGALPPIFSEVTPTIGGKIIFTITAEMIDETTEVGNYTFQIRLLDDNMESRATLPEVKNGIEIREPIALEDISTTNEVEVAAVGYALTTAGTSEDTFDSQGNYNKTTWVTGDRITAVKLNKMETGIDEINKKVASGGTGSDVDLSNYVTKETGNANQITFSDGQTFQAKLNAGTLKGDKGEQGIQGPKGDKGDKGDAGTNGQDGATFIPSVDTEGNLSWTNDKGLANPPTVNIKGEKGDSGTGSSGANNINVDNCNFFTKFYNVYDNKSVNDLGLNNSGTLFFRAGGYVSDYIEVKKYVYADKIGFVCWYDENESFIYFDGSTKVAKKLDVPDNAKYFRYEVWSGDISTASVYNVDEELPEFPPKTKLNNTYLDINFINKAIIEKNKYTTTIACYGDSLTEGAGSTNAGVYSYPTRLESLINEHSINYSVSVYNRGIGGNTSKAIIAKSGCYADMVEPFTIPADTTPVAITKNGLLANNVGGTISIRNGVNPVTIGGIEGDLSYENGTYKFARLKAGEEVQITRPVQILPSASKTDKNAILIICVGTNDADKAEANYPPKLIQRIRRMIEYLDCKKFIVLGLTVNEKETVNPALEEEFGANFLDIHKYLINYGLSDNGLTATNEDLEDINNGLIPRQIRSDDVHYNNDGYYSKAMGVYLKGKDLGYWK